MSAPPPLDRDAKVYVAGHGGLVGSAIWRRLEAEGFTRLVGRRSAELDLRDHEAVRAFFNAERPDVVVIAAAKVGGIHANNTYPADFLSENLRIQTSLMDAALEHRIEAAVDAVCEKPAMRDLKAMVAWEECKAAARAGAIDQLSILESYETLALSI